MLFLYLMAFLLVASAAAFSVAVVFSRHYLATTPSGLLARLTPAVILAVMAALAAYQGATLRVAAAELRRVQRQLLSVNAYLLPLPNSAQHLLRAAMLRRLFP